MEWISVKYRLPEKATINGFSDWVLTTNHRGDMCVSRYDHVEGWWDEFAGITNVTHWMPMPESLKN